MAHSSRGNRGSTHQRTTPHAAWPERRRGARAGLLAALLSLSFSCGAIPVIPDDVATSIAENKMDTLETSDMRLHYPRQRRDEALRFLERTEGCVAYLRARTQLHNGIVDQKLNVVLPEVPFNNAFAFPRALGHEPLAVIPSYNTAETFGLELGLMSDPKTIACHELTHYVHGQQIGGFAWAVNSVFGNLATPQIGLDPWFREGLATFYETQMQPGTGRMAWPYWLGVFAAGVAGRELNGGDLSAANRDFHFSNSYLIGSHFIRFLVEKYGEERLWRLIAVQGRSILFPFAVNVRFWQAYDKSLSTLIDEFAADTRAKYPVRSRPAGQRLLFQGGFSARYARGNDGTQALIDEDHDAVTRLRILSADGQVRVDRTLVEVIPPRTLNQASAIVASGMSFTADGRSLYVVIIDQGTVYQRSRLVRFDVATGDQTLVAGDLGGPGGAISPDGTRFVFPRPDGDRHDLAVLDVATGAVKVLWSMAPGTYVAQPRFSPDGRQIVATVFESGRLGLVLFDGATGKRLRVLPTGEGPVVDPSFVDDHRVVFLGVTEDAAIVRAGRGREGFQVFLHDLTSGQTLPITKVPYLAFQPQGAGGRTVRFLNREGWSWTIDEVELPAAPVAATLVAATVAAETAETVAPPVVKPLSPQADPAPATSTEAASAGEAAADDAPPPAPEAAPPPASEVTLAPSPGPPAVSAVPTVLSERPYSSWSTVFVPKLIVPGFSHLLSPGRMFDVALNGADRLEQHLWAGDVHYQPLSQLWSYDAVYVNRQLAPVTFELIASQWRFHDTPARAPDAPSPTAADYTLYHRDTFLAADISRSIYGNPISLGMVLLDTYRPGNTDEVFQRVRVAGPSLSATYFGADASPYGGLQRALIVDGGAAYYPRALSANDLNFADLSLHVLVAVPLPLSRRHSLRLTGAARVLPGAPSDQPLLQIGGIIPDINWRRPDRPLPPDLDPPQLPPGARLVEQLRGFEDFPLAANRYLSAGATYNYPFIVDKGSASSLGVLPAAFFSQFNLQVFGNVATTQFAGYLDKHAVVGGSFEALFSLGLFDFRLRYQLARRLSDDQALAQLLSLEF